MLLCFKIYYVKHPLAKTMASPSRRAIVLTIGSSLSHPNPNGDVDPVEEIAHH